ncbi:MAG: FTR1 family iron permease [Alphaproteobacteria bacterium]
MLSSAIVVFREVFEIVLIVGIVLAATKTMPHRRKAILIGFGAGLAGSALVALFTGRISQIAEGLGQQYFNAGILFFAAGFIGWTVLWMKKNARFMKQNFQKIGEAVSGGRAPFMALSAIIALTILREGSEIVLFTYGMLASGQSPMMIVAGSAAGLIAGLIVGILLYMGLIKLSVRVFFQVTSWLLIFLVAGMVSKAFGFLVAAGAFANLSQTVWDTSGFLSDHGILGESLGTLVGYTARPAAIQVIAYISALLISISTMKLIDKNMNLKTLLKGSAAASLLFIAALPVSQAHATSTVDAPYVDKGDFTLEEQTNWLNDDDDDDIDGTWAETLNMGYSPTDNIKLEIEGEFGETGAGDDTEFNAVTFSGTWEFFEAGRYWLESGLKFEYGRNTSGDADGVAVKLLLAKEAGKFSHLANFVFGQETGEDSSDDTSGAFAWSTSYAVNDMFQPGFEYYLNHDDVSDGGSFDDQGHQLGPVVYGGIGEHIGYEAGYLFGLSDSAADGEAKLIINYTVNFN